jgi:DNA-binding response OmpR family regulator
MPLGASALAGRRILVVEDEFFLADDLRQILHEQNVEVLGPAATVTKALKVIRDEGPIDCAVLDVNLCGEVVYPISAVLGQRKIPFLFATGYGSTQIPAEFANILRLEKPFEPAALLTALETIIHPARA